MSAPTVVIGGGVDALVAAHWLAQAGEAVLLLDEQVEAPTSTSGWIAPAIIRELNLSQHGLVVDVPDPWIRTPLPGGGRLDLWRDIARTANAIRAVSRRDADRWPAFCEAMRDHASVLEALYTAAPPDVMTNDWREIWHFAKIALRTRRLGRARLESFLRLIPMSIADLLNDWFESDALKGVLGAAGVMQLHQGPRSGGTALVFLHHHVGSTPGVFRPMTSNIGAVLAKRPGIERRTSVRVKHIDVEAGSAIGVTLTDNTHIAATRVVSGASPRKTLLEWVDAAWLEPEAVRAIRNIRARGVVAQVELTLDRAPGFTSLAFAPSLDYLERAYDEAKYRRISGAPLIEARYVAPDNADGNHTVKVHMQFAPYALADGTWDTPRKQAVVDTVTAALSSQLPRDAIRSTLCVSPADAHEKGSTAGQAHHAELALDQFLWMRPTPSLARYRTPIRGLYLCGPAMHPGAGTAGASGMLAAQTVLSDR
jgi:phytoene dehydrogenase-like protein